MNISEEPATTSVVAEAATSSRTLVDVFESVRHNSDHAFRALSGSFISIMYQYHRGMYFHLADAKSSVLIHASFRCISTYLLNMTLYEIGVTFFHEHCMYTAYGIE